MVEGRDPNEPLFLTETGVEWSMYNLRKQINKYRGEIPIEAYAFRHCWITDMVDANVNLLTIAKTAGTSVDFIQSNYTTGMDSELPEL
jgi:integrase